MLTQLTHHDASALGIGLNFPIFISTMAVNVFHADARGFGLLSSIMAIGTISGALLAAASRPRFGSVVLGNSAKSFPVTCPKSRFAVPRSRAVFDCRLPGAICSVDVC